jgi:hypothetical protein
MQFVPLQSNGCTHLLVPRLTSDDSVLWPGASLKVRRALLVNHDQPLKPLQLCC